MSVANIQIEDLIGIPFVEGGRTLTGLDCWGLVLEVQRRCGRSLKDPFRPVKSATALAAGGERAEDVIQRLFDAWAPVPRMQAGPGHVVAFSDWTHAGVLLDARRFLHALHGVGVCLGHLDREPWHSRMMGIYAYAGA